MAVTANTIASEAGIDLERATRLLAAAVAIVDGYGGNPPAEIRDECVVRVCVHLARQPGFISQTAIGEWSTVFRGSPEPLRATGSEALLSRYRSLGGVLCG